MKLFGIFVIFQTVYDRLINDSTKAIKSAVLNENISFHYPIGNNKKKRLIQGSMQFRQACNNS